ncbi:MAG: coenzyme F420-0:L-glutamate ligase [Chloroflexi bacterium]|nr:coenzyme F420-0:L-glutamate ligase [Chloroflexota bacterium]
MTLTLTPLSGIPFIRAGDDLASIVHDALRASHITLHDGDALVLAQKIVSKAEGRMVNLGAITPSERALELAARTDKDPRFVELILRESKEVLRVRPGLIIVEHRLGFVCANAGIDHSNVSPLPPQREGLGVGVSDWVLLLPENPDASAAALRKRLEVETGARVGVMIIDSHGRAWRLGIVGISIGFSGLPGLADLRGWPDLFDRALEVTQVGVADELAAAASLVMGQAAEGTPVVHVRGFPYPLREGSLGELLRPKDEDLFR